MRPSLAILAVAALLMLATPIVVGEVYQAGEGAQPVLVLVDALGETEKSWVDAVAESQGAAVGMIATDVFTGAPGNETAELLAAMESNGVEASTQHPVMGIGNAAYHSLLLSYDAWPVVVAVTPDLNPESAPLPARDSPVAEADAAPLLLVIADVNTNGPFVTDTEEALDAAGIHWETVRYGGVTAGFYMTDPEVWARAFGVINSFLDDAKAGGTPGTTDPGEEVPSSITVVSPFMYNDTDVELEGYLAYPTEAVDAGSQLPLVIVLPDWEGLNEYEFKRVRMLADMGYVALGADIYDLPIGTTVEAMDERIAYVTGFLSDPPMYVQRIRAAVTAAKALPYVDETKVGLIGYCFGGSGAVFDVFDDSSLQVDVSFHGGLANKPNTTTTPPMQPYMSYQSGGADESPEDVLWLQTSLTEMGGDWDITRYSMVPHGFSKWGPADSAYHARADGRSWAAMKALFGEYMPLPASSESSMETPSDSHASSLSFGSALMACVALLMAALWN
mmetsp:Transcript_20529/g.36616  ORF Transcript_20529/g.36616 Transcript_20529/m.36616 type:complete len:505 (-) Transcript_20529:152-1666(-)|eukprot:CAMPEP_0177762758 /NCGR_PEP_ID=MMETSP0491_2-20121128/6513_1 /TAXON_ID=63592 /ORGANISM="Tetraselmis chuii, Strain PLY429" /LENGTH=504 /DNA_ID=CAMNT_0019278829 /DNA_START=571 /DNA_END=2085 /DNA_ORIENTATION=-